MPRRTILAQELKERHVNMMAFSACIGFGLFLQSGRVIYIAGPGLAIIAYLLACSVMWCVLACLGEMTALFPVQGPIFEFPGRFLDEAVGYAAGWTAWFAWVVIMAAELLAVAQLWQFRFTEKYLREVEYPQKTLGWGSTDSTSPAVWVVVFLIVILFVNFLPIRHYGQLEYIFGSIKMTFISLLILFNVVLSALQRSHLPHADHFWTWNSPYGFASHDLILRQAADGSASKKIGGGAGHFLALWTAVTTCVFSLVGFETIAVTAPENRDLEKHETIKLASRKLFMRITILYSLCTFAGGLNVPYNDSYLFDIQNNDVHAGQNSIYVLAAVRSRLTGYPHFMNGFFIFSATTSAINGLYNSSRILHAIASIPEAWPIPLQQMRRRLEMTTSRGVPMATILVSWLFGLLAFLAVGRFPSIILGRMSTNAIVSELLVYAVICASYIIFHGRIKKAASDYGLENRAAFDRGDAQYPYRSHGQLARSYYGLAFCVLLIVFNGWRSFVTPFSTPDFIVSYIGIVAFAVIVCLYHIKMDGWNPLNWRRHASMEIFRPPPKAVVPGRRRGVLEIKDEKGSFKVMGLVDWLWCWLK